MDAPAAVVLAAGKSKRMQSETPKVLHQVCGRPMVEYVLDAARAAGVKRVIAIVGHKAELVQSALAHHPDVEFALQSEQLGTGHAVMMAEPLLRDHRGPVLVLAGDTPLLTSSSLSKLVAAQNREQAACVVGTAETDANEGLGRIVRDENGAFLRIVEQKDASPAEQKIREINSGCFAFDGPALFEALARVRPTNAQKEYYLTDCAEILRQMGRPVSAQCCMDIQEVMGVNTQEQLAEVERVMQQRSGT
jgi:bifunctional UDP-N-acetylglucosamine pyrophosphorylase/glucosamine-1-phosphate N-acetyltransferase